MWKLQTQEDLYCMFVTLRGTGTSAPKPQKKFWKHQNSSGWLGRIRSLLQGKLNSSSLCWGRLESAPDRAELSSEMWGLQSRKHSQAWCRMRATAFPSALPWAALRTNNCSRTQQQHQGQLEQLLRAAGNELLWKCSVFEVSQAITQVSGVCCNTIHLGAHWICQQ